MKSTLSDDRIRTALSRKFGRNTYPSQTYHQKWNVKVTNPKTKKENDVILEGLQSFFE